MRTPSRRSARPVTPTRHDIPTTVTALTPPPPTVPPADAPEGDGIRWDLVARMKDLIAAGHLDTPERWTLAEELLFDAAERGA